MVTLSPRDPHIQPWLPGGNLLMCLKHPRSKGKFKRGHQVQPRPWMSSLIVTKYLSTWIPSGMWNSLLIPFFGEMLLLSLLLFKEKQVFVRSLYPWVQIVFCGPHGVYLMPVLLRYNSPLIILWLERDGDVEMEWDESGKEREASLFQTKRSQFFYLFKLWYL